MKRVLRSPITYGILAAALIVTIAVLILGTGGGPTTLSTGQFEHDLATGQVQTATIHDGADKVTGDLVGNLSYQATYPDRYTPQITAEIAKAVPDFKTDHPHTSVWVSLLSYLPLIILFGLFGYLLYSTQNGGRMASFSKVKAKGASKDQPKVTFADVAGADEAVAELTEIKEFLEAPGRFEALGARVPKGVLLVGPPGTGKTLLARAVAGEAGVPFFSISGSDFVEMFVGVGASRVRNLFEQAKSAAPAIIFMDEIDAVGRHRGAGLGGGHDEREQTLNQLLVEMDGFDTKAGVILIAATNRPDILDPALLRPGRFDRQVTVDRPDKGGRRKILEVHAKGKPLNPSASLDVLAKRTPGFTGADLANLLNEAALLTARRNLRQIGMRECEEAIDRVVAGPERTTLVLSEHDKAVTAYHEAGHVIVGHVLPHTDPIHKVSIIARSRSLGLTFTLPEDRFNHSRSQLRDAMAMCLGGRSAEELVFDEPTTGAENDIEKATRLARAMVTEYGMSDRLGPQQFAHPNGEVFLGREMGTQSHLSDEINALVDGEVRFLIDEAHERAVSILRAHAGTLETLAQALIEAETLAGSELMAIIGGLDSWHSPSIPALPPAPPSSPAAPRSPSTPVSPSTSASPSPSVPSSKSGSSRRTRSGRTPRSAKPEEAAVPDELPEPAVRRTASSRPSGAPDSPSPSPARSPSPAPSKAKAKTKAAGRGKGGPVDGPATRRRKAENPGS